ncbi:Phosphatidylinositol 4-phosphate 5-kinase its3 [Escovopsis weberi]|uniref:1-phosphatidylinositol-4-phosphate 5-kinase n=1 Tax=Escovopsis weberi TaxID=150374 RepID=A0A0M9VSY6_ESCWE|nr:Phosphatidylinositol 4-phosphate 5-kinase its3 [Escovopsis weberi]
MPSYLTDDHPNYFANTLDLEHDDGQFRLDFTVGKDRVNVSTLTPQRSFNIAHESFDESSTLSTRDSESSDSPMPSHGHDQWREDRSGHGTRPTSLSSVSDDGATFALPDRSVPRQTSVAGGACDGLEAAYINSSTSANFSRPVNETTTLFQSTIHQWTALNSNASNYGPAPRPAQPTDVPQSQSQSQSHSPPPSRTPSFAPASPTSEFTLPPRASRRFSSPPAHQPGSAPSSPPSSGHFPSSGPGGVLKQRHVQSLESPRPSQSRPFARDALDTAQASGRFSPTFASPATRRASISLARRTTRSMQSDAPRDEIVPDEDALRWAEAYRQKRASKRRRKEEEDDGRVLVGTKVDETHANWVTAYNMLTGIRVSVSRTNAKLDRELTDADFETKQKSTFDITGNELVPSAKYDFKFKDYAPWVFRHLRGAFRLDAADYLMSLTGKYILSELGSPGKSGSFFYFSRDYKYIIKTIHHAEHKFLRKILRQYWVHVKENPNTLLSQFYGLHRVKTPYGKKIHFVVMNNLFPPHRDIHTTFDLKGSTIGRDTKEDAQGKNSRPTLKDLNWLRRKQHLELGIQKKQLFLQQLQRDVGLLKRLHIMDYSLLVGIHDLSRGNEENLRDKTLQVFNPGAGKSADEEFQPHLLRTPSKMENYRKARELREMVQSQRPIPMGQAMNKMPEELAEDPSRRDFIFNQDDGGFQATHEDNEPADEIYYLGVIDCLTHYGMIKKFEHFWKGLSNDKSKISALPPDQYGDRFYDFIQNITMSAEEAQREVDRMDMEALQAERAEREMKQSQRLPELPKDLPPLPPTHELSCSIEAGDFEQVRDAQSASATDGPNHERALRADLQHESILPIVEEVGESSKSVSRRWGRPPGSWPSHITAPYQDEPPTPPPHLESFLKPDSSDSGYGDNSNDALSRDNSLRLVRQVSHESLNKHLPPVPKKEATTDDSGIGGIRLVA